jgi:hypothetical protein
MNSHYKLRLHERLPEAEKLIDLVVDDDGVVVVVGGGGGGGGSGGDSGGGGGGVDGECGEEEVML